MHYLTAASDGRNRTTGGNRIMMNMTTVLSAMIGMEAL